MRRQASRCRTQSGRSATDARAPVRVDTDRYTERQSEIEIRPGMRATVELQTGSKTILRCLPKPLYKARNAFREP